MKLAPLDSTVPINHLCYSAAHQTHSNELEKILSYTKVRQLD